MKINLCVMEIRHLAGWRQTRNNTQKDKRHKTYTKNLWYWDVQASEFFLQVFPFKCWKNKLTAFFSKNDCFFFVI